MSSDQSQLSAEEIERQQTLDQVAEILSQAGFDFEYLYPGTMIRFQMRVPSPVQELTVIVDCEDDAIMVLAVCLLSADLKNEDLMEHLQDYLHRINYGFIPGSFELDYDTGRIRYRITSYNPDCGFDRMSIVKQLVGAVMPYVIFGNGLMKVIFQDVSGLDAYNQSIKELAAHAPDTEDLQRLADELPAELAGFNQSVLGEDQINLAWVDGTFDLLRLMGASEPGEPVDLMELFGADEDDDLDEDFEEYYSQDDSDPDEDQEEDDDFYSHSGKFFA